MKKFIKLKLEDVLASRLETVAQETGVSEIQLIEQAVKDLCTKHEMRPDCYITFNNKFKCSLYAKIETLRKDNSYDFRALYSACLSIRNTNKDIHHIAINTFIYYLFPNQSKEELNKLKRSIIFYEKDFNILIEDILLDFSRLFRTTINLK